MQTYGVQDRSADIYAFNGGILKLVAGGRTPAEWQFPTAKGQGHETRKFRTSPGVNRVDGLSSGAPARHVACTV